MQVVKVDEYLYCLSGTTAAAGAESGIQVFDLAHLFNAKEKTTALLKFKTSHIGRSLFYHKKLDRVYYLSSFITIDVLPLLHRNTHSFLGGLSSTNRDEYLSVRKHLDLVYGLRNRVAQDAT